MHQINQRARMALGGKWLHGGFLNLIHDLVDARNLCWAEIAAALGSYYRGKETVRLGVLQEVFASVDLYWNRGPLTEVDFPGDYLKPLEALEIAVGPQFPVHFLTGDIVREEIEARRAIIVDWSGSPGHCALITGYIASQDGHFAVEIADPGGGKSLVALAALDTVGWEQYRLTEPRPDSNFGSPGSRNLNWSGIRESIKLGNFLGLVWSTETIRQWGGFIPVIGDDQAAAVLNGAEAPVKKSRWVDRRGRILRAVDQDAAFRQVLQWSDGPWLADAAAKISAIEQAGEKVVAWVDSVALRQRGWIVAAADHTRRRVDLVRPVKRF